MKHLPPAPPPQLSHPTQQPHAAAYRRAAALAAVLGLSALGAGCAHTAAAQLTGKTWQVLTVGNQALPTGTGATAVTLTLSDQGQANGSGPCNRFSASYQLKGQTLTFGPVAATRRACVGEGMAHEKALFDALARVNRFELTPAGVLSLHTAQGVALTAH